MDPDPGYFGQVGSGSRITEPKPDPDLTLFDKKMFIISVNVSLYLQNGPIRL